MTTTPLDAKQWEAMYRRPLLVLLAVSVVGASCILGGVFVGDWLLAMIGPERLSDAAIDALFTLVIFVPIIILSFVGNIMSGGGAMLAGRSSASMALFGLVMGASGLLIAAAFAGLAGIVVPAAAATGPTWLILGGAVLVLVQSSAEEFLLRGWLQPILVRYWPGWVAILLSALLFMALHLLGGTRASLTLLNLFLGGVMFGLLAYRSGGLAAPIAAHWAWNVSESLILGLDPNPGVGAFGSLFDLDMIGSRFWAGADEGLNGGAAITFVLIAFLLPLSVWGGIIKPPRGVRR